jgi:excisionase family DNA binding protein
MAGGMMNGMTDGMTNGKPGRLLLTAAEAAEALAISERTLWALTDRGEIPAIRIGRSVRYAVEDLRAWVDAQRRRPDGGPPGPPSAGLAGRPPAG